MKNLYKIKNDLYIIDNNEKVTQNGIWAKCSFTGDILKNRNGQHAYKVILTTNDSLIKDGVQAIDDELLEWFVKNPSCESVEVDKFYKANPKYKEGSQLTEKVGYWSYKIIIPKQKTKDRIMSETSEETKQKARDYGNSLIKQDRTCTHNCSAVCGECQILEPKPLLSVDWLLRYIEGLAKKGYTFSPSSNKEIVEHVKQMEKDNMINFLKSVFQQDGFDYEKAYNNFLKQQI